MPTIRRRESLTPSILTDTDSYKFSHWNQYPPGTRRMMSYFESRGGEFEESTLFGLQYLLHEYLARPIGPWQVDEAAQLAEAHGVPFHREGWERVVRRHYGRLPVRIRAIPEGTVVPTGNAIMTVESLDPEAFWIVSWIETMLVRLWYPSTVAIASRESKKVLKRYLDWTADEPEAELPFKLHDFGARGVATLEQSRLGGAAHLLNFFGTDTIEALRFARRYYDCDMAGFSIPAAEHSTMTMWGREREFEAYGNMVDQYLGEGRMAAVVSDSYDFFRALEEGWGGQLHDKVKESGGTLVIRPDSGDPVKVLIKAFQILEDKIGMTTNSKGFKVLPPYFRVIQGDGIDRHSMNRILGVLSAGGYSASNIAFGSGGGLLQKFNRDTQKWAFKCCAAEVNGEWVDVRKDPATDSGKRSKAGRLDLIRTEDGYQTIALDNDSVAHPDSVMTTVFEMGDITHHNTFAEIRERMAL